MTTRRTNLDATDDAARVPHGMVLVPGGSYWIGCDSADIYCDSAEKPRHEVILDSFYVDVTETTVEAYGACVKSGHCRQPLMREGCNYGHSDRDDHPVNCVSWDDAVAFCKSAGKRLPSNAEWEAAARGHSDRIYPWGDMEPSCEYAVVQVKEGYGCGHGSTEPVGSKPAGASPYGVLDMAGNVGEWVQDLWDREYYHHSPSHNPQGPDQGMDRTHRGGSWYGGGFLTLRVSARRQGMPTFRTNFTGFRCAQSAN